MACRKKIRFSSSSIPHKVKTWKSNMDELARKIINSKPFSSILTVYGLAKLETAKLPFAKKIGLLPAAIIDIGLFLCPELPWACCSPDGLLFENEELFLLEIKCPSVNHDAVQQFLEVMEKSQT